MFFKGIAYFLALSQTIFATIITLIIQQRLTNPLIGLFSQPHSYKIINFPSIPQFFRTSVFAASNAIRHDGAPAVPPCSPDA